MSQSYTIEDYSDKSFAIFGDLAPIEELLVALKGTFNDRLRDALDSNKRRAGFIFPKARRAEIEKALKEGKVSTKKEYSSSSSTSSVSSVSSASSTPNVFADSALEGLVKKMQEMMVDMQRRMDAVEAEVGVLTKLYNSGAVNPNNMKPSRKKTEVTIEDIDAEEEEEETDNRISILKALRKKTVDEEKTVTKKTSKK
jgi:hypothetical protein